MHHFKSPALGRGLAAYLLAVVLLPLGLWAQDTTEAVPELKAADAALASGKYPEAIRLATQLISADPKDFRALFLRGKAYESSGDYPKALADYSAGLKLKSDTPFGYQNRGAVYFRLGQFAQSISDFDKFLEAMPNQAPHHWQRGISLYYAGRYEDGRKQFELHQTVNAHDVENAVWHFLCVARASSPEQARAVLIPIQGDARVPMMEVHALFAGKAKPETVLAAARAGKPDEAQLENRLFYAHLYLGLYYEAIGDAKLAEEHIFKAASFKAPHYMGDVARVHAQVIRLAKARGGKPATGPAK